MTHLPGVNFINILRAYFLYESKLSSFSLVTFGFVIFGAKISYEKRACKMLMKLTTGLLAPQKIMKGQMMSKLKMLINKKLTKF